MMSPLHGPLLSKETKDAEAKLRCDDTLHRRSLLRDRGHWLSKG